MVFDTLVRLRTLSLRPRNLTISATVDGDFAASRRLRRMLAGFGVALDRGDHAFEHADHLR